jgi:hypothetical protein
MMGTYRIFIADLLEVLTAELARSLRLQLERLFAPCTAGRFQHHAACFANRSVKPFGHEMLVYFMPPNLSIVKNVPNMIGSPNLGADGTTAPNAGASEVYVKSDHPLFLAKIAFHELMHNRLRLSNAELHGQGGLASASIQANTPLTPANIQSMAKVIADPITQWTEGIDILASGALDSSSEYHRANWPR